MKNRMFSLVLMAIMVVTTLGLTSCGSKEAETGVKVYQNADKRDSEVPNVWTSFYLLDEDTYLFTCYALDSKDTEKVTADMSMKGQYTLDGNTLNIELGYGYVKALNGDTVVEMPVTAENGSMYYAMVGGQFTSFTLNEDGTFAVAE